jgi:hypothetical protein
LKKLILASENKKYLKKFENLEIPFLMLIEMFFFFKNLNFPWKLKKAKGCRELDHTQYELARFDQLINISEN